VAEETQVERGDFVVSARSGDLLAARDLGSCVAVCVHDHERGVGGIANVMLPNSATADAEPEFGPGLFADTAIGLLVADMCREGATTANCVVHVVGGADLLPAPGGVVFALGSRNVAAVDARIDAEKLQTGEREVGGWRLRHVELQVGDGRVVIEEA